MLKLRAGWFEKQLRRPATVSIDYISKYTHRVIIRSANFESHLVVLLTYQYRSETVNLPAPGIATTLSVDYVSVTLQKVGLW